MSDDKQQELNVQDTLELLLERMDEISARQAAMAEIVVAWNNTKGFVKTVQAISKGIRWIAITGAGAGALWYFITHGNWPK